MSCLVQDVLLSYGADGKTHAMPRAQIAAAPTSLPFSLKSGSAYNALSSPQPTSVTDVNGNWSITLPWPSESNPSTEQWQLTFPDGTIWQGTVPEGVSGPFTLWTLRSSYGWVVGASPPPAGYTLPDATTTVTGAVLIDVAPSGAHPVAVTQTGLATLPVTLSGGLVTINPGPLKLVGAVPVTASSGLVSFGPGPFDGTSAGHFVGSANGTLVAGNAASGYTGYLVDVQVAGSRRLAMDAYGHLLFGGAAQPTISGVIAGCTVTIYASMTATDVRGIVQIQVGGANVSPGGTPIFQLNFANAFPGLTSIQLTWVGAAAPAPLSQGSTASYFQVYMPTGTLVANATYFVAYTALG